MLEDIRELMHRQPFEPFRIILISGKEYTVTNPDLLAIGKTRFTLYAPKSDKWAMLRITEVASAEDAQAA